jgi:hypothetical protein
MFGTTIVERSPVTRRGNRDWHRRYIDDVDQPVKVPGDADIFPAVHE